MKFQYYIIVLAILLAFTNNSFSQTISVSGYITDALSGEHLPGAVIKNLSEKGETSSNFYGYYKFTLQKGRVSIVAKTVGFKNDTLHLIVNRDTSINIAL